MAQKPIDNKFINYDDFKRLVEEVEPHRQERLIDLTTFLEMSKDSTTIILDTRSATYFNRKHIKRAVNLDFSDFTKESLRAIIPSTNTRILIYCNNNFVGDQINFTTKTTGRPAKPLADITSLALNIPTYINLYAYGYQNVYELVELISVDDPRVKFEGTEVK